MKKVFAAVLALLIVSVVPVYPDVIVGKQITVTAGTAIRVATGNNLTASSLFIQMKHGGSGIGYVLYADPSVTCSVGGAGTALVAELAPATSTSPGGAFTYPSNNDSADKQGGINPAWFCVDGTNSGDVIVTSYSQH